MIRTMDGAFYLLSLMALTVFASACLGESEPQLPLPSGQYVFQHRFAEHPEISSIRLDVTIKDAHITVINPTASDPFPAGVLSEGMLIWHAPSKQWIIGQQASDRLARDVGGCSDGPEVVDLENKTYWTC